MFSDCYRYPLLRLYISALFGIGGAFCMPIHSVWVQSGLCLCLLLSVLAAYLFRHLYPYAMMAAFCAGSLMVAIRVPEGLKTNVYTDNHLVRHSETQVQDHLRRKIESAAPPTVARAFVETVTIGYRHNLLPETRALFRQAGVSHLLAISGYHLSLLLLFAHVLIRFLGRSVWWQWAFNLLSIIPLLYYAAITGMQPSVTRAVLMFAILQVTLVLERAPSLLNTSCLTALLMLIYDPLLITHIGFQLSFMAILGIAVMAIPLMNMLRDAMFERTYRELIFGGDYIRLKRRENICSAIAGTVLVPLSCQLFTLPLTAYHFGTVSLTGFFSNLASSLLVPPLMLTTMVWFMAVMVYGTMPDNTFMDCLLHALWQMIEWGYAALEYTLRLLSF